MSKLQSTKPTSVASAEDQFDAEIATGPDSGERPPQCGFRLSKLEIYNWGTFDGAVYRMQPNGTTTLLVGENGSGKSTVVDALLTLLVKPQTRNYNVAAGATKNERDERTYIRGAHDRTVGSDGRPQVQFLRSGQGHYTVLLACFQNGQKKQFTLSQVLYLNSEGGVERIYAYCDTERGILQDLGDLESSSGMARQLRERGFETTTSYTQYFHWFQKKTGLRSKAMDVFNQTVAVKDVQRLDSFIRQHMLERQPWNDRINKFLAHFNELSEAHQTLVRVRQQNELLKPIVAAGQVFRSKSMELDASRRLLQATPLYFQSARVTLLDPICSQWSQQIRHHLLEIERLDQVLERLRTDIVRLELTIEDAGGERLRQLPLAIEQAQQAATRKRAQRRSYEEFLLKAGIDSPLTSSEALQTIHIQTAERRRELSALREHRRKQASDLQYEMGRLTREWKDAQGELASLSQRQGNLPESLMAIRERLCHDLQLSPNNVPFAAELLEIPSEHREWEASIEQVLASFARSLLVAPEYYRRVAAYVESTRLIDHRGRGQRLVYLQVAPRGQQGKVEVSQGSLAAKLHYRQHPFQDWIKREVASRFDYLACDSIEQFQKATGPAMTKQRHVKSNAYRHEKDDRVAPDDRRNFVLGWDNHSKRTALQESLQRQGEELQGLRDREAKFQAEIDGIHSALEALDMIARVEIYDELDFARHEAEAAKLHNEQQKLEASNDVVRELRSQMAGLREQVARHQAERDQYLAQKTRLELDEQNGRQLLTRAQRELKKAEDDGGLIVAAEQFSALRERVGEALSLENMAMLPETFERSLRVKVEQQAARLVPVSREVTNAMAKFLRHFPEEQTDLDPDVASLESFEALYEKISGDDLPRHEERFKHRLNENVLHEIGLLNGSFENDRQEIRDKIDQLNSGLRRMQWKPGTYMRLEATDVADREIQDFRRDLANCLSGTLEGTSDANEANFVRIEKLVGKLRDDTNQRWREKVVDVRNWFHFAAQEWVAETGETRSYYDGGTGQSGGEKGKLAFLVLVAAIAYQYDIDPERDVDQRFHFVMVDEMFSRSDDQHAQYALELFRQFGLQLLIVAPLDSKVRVTEDYVETYVHVVKDKTTHRSQLYSLSAAQFENGLSQTE